MQQSKQPLFSLAQQHYSQYTQPVSVLIFHPTEIEIIWSQTVRHKKKNKKSRIFVGNSNVNVQGTRAQHAH